MAVPAAGPGLRGDLHRRDPGEDPRGPGREPARLPGAGGDRRRGAGHPGPVGRGARRWRGRQVLAAGPDRDQEPRDPGRAHGGLRRAEGAARLGEFRLEKTIVQTCIVRLLRNSFKYASKRDWAAIAKDIKPVYTAVSEAAALDAFAEFSGKWEHRYPAIIKLWENAWPEFVPFLRFDREIRTEIGRASC